MSTWHEDLAGDEEACTIRSSGLADASDEEPAAEDSDLEDQGGKGGQANN